MVRRILCVGYGAGLVLGVKFASFLFNVTTLELFADFDEAVRLMIGVILTFVIAGLAGIANNYDFELDLF